MDSNEVQNFAAEMVSNARAIHRIVSSVEFRLVLFRASEGDRYGLRSILKELDRDGLLLWIKKVRTSQKDYYGLKVKDLREMARLRGIPDYQSLNKETLIYLHEEEDAR